MEVEKVRESEKRRLSEDDWTEQAGKIHEVGSARERGLKKDLVCMPEGRLNSLSKL